MHELACPHLNTGQQNQSAADERGRDFSTATISHEFNHRHFP